MQIYISMQRGITRSIGEFIVWIFLHKFVSGVFITLSFPCSFYKLFNVFDLMYSRVNKGVGFQSRISWRVCWSSRSSSLEKLSFVAGNVTGILERLD